MYLTGGFDHHSIAFPDPALNNSDQRHDTKILIEPGIDDQRLQGRLHISDRRRYIAHQPFQQIRYAHTRFRGHRDDVVGIKTDDVFDLSSNALRFRLR